MGPIQRNHSRCPKLRTFRITSCESSMSCKVGGTSTSRLALSTACVMQSQLWWWVPMTHPRGHVSNYSRSVASVVASTEPDLMHYPGSVRCQDTLRMPLRHEDAEKRYFRSTIIDLEGMMVERFKAWKAAAGDHSPGVVFYREGLINLSEKIVLRETTAIRDAFSKIFGKNIQALSYIVVHESSSEFGEPQWKEETLLDRSLVLSTHRLANSKKSTACTYYVLNGRAGIPRVRGGQQDYEKLVCSQDAGLKVPKLTIYRPTASTIAAIRFIQSTLSRSLFPFITHASLLSTA
jgi:hypothetical protein